MKFHHHLVWSIALGFLSMILASAPVIAQQKDTPPPQVSGDDFPRTRDLTGGSDLTSGGTVFSFPKKPTFKFRRTIPRRTTKPMPVTHAPAAEIWKRLGVTVWRLEDGSVPETDKVTARMLVQESGTAKTYTPKRVAGDVTFLPGDKVRLSFESPVAGYLYVFDREIHADGSLGAPYQIFPTRMARGGDSMIQAGSLIDIPSQADQVPYFTLKSDDKNWRGELLTVVVAAAPISGVPTLEKPSPVAASLVESLEEKYLREATEYEQEGTAGLNYTKNEQQAANTVGTRQLTQGDPFPQTVYQVKTRTSDPLVVNLRLALK